MKRRSARTTFSTAQLALWDELETVKPAASAPAAAPSEGTPRTPPPPGPPLHDTRRGAR
jgi:hypothetical protein